MFTSTRQSRRLRNPQAQDEKASASPFFTSSLQRKEQQSSNAFFQAKSAMETSGDAYEKEADNVAHSVVEQKKGSSGLPKISAIQKLATDERDEKLGTNDARMRRDRDIQEKMIQPKDAEEEKDKKKKTSSVQTKPADGGGIASENISSRLKSASGGGSRIPANTLNEMNRSFGTDFHDVNIHTDAEAVKLNKDLQAQAFTHGRDIYFNEGRFDTSSKEGKFLLAHELTHVVQQRGASDNIHRKKAASGPPLNFVCYTGGHFGIVTVVKDGAVTYRSQAVSGIAGGKQNQKNAGPTPNGKYVIHPGITNHTVSKPEDGTCSVNAISKGYQEITATDHQACDHDSHYCNEPCTESPVHNCYSPVGCWGTRRIRIEGSHVVVADDGKKITRGSFYLHGGNPKDLASSGCIKALDMAVFDKIRELKGAIPFFVGECPGLDTEMITGAFMNIASGNAESMQDKSPAK